MIVNPPLLTVVMPTYNRRHLLEQALSSVLNQCQGDPRILIHVWDNHSTDQTEEFMRKIQETNVNIRYTRRDENTGASANYTDALSKVETEFYVGLADDDLLLPGFLVAGLAEFASDPTLGAVIMQTIHRTPDGVDCRINPDDRWTFGRMEPLQMMEQWTRLGHLEWSSIIFKKTAHDAVGGIDESIGLASDVDFQMQVFLRFPVKLISTPAAIYTIHPQQGSNQIGLSYIETAARITGRLHDFSKKSVEFTLPLKALKFRYAKEFSKWGWQYSSVKSQWTLCRSIVFKFNSPYHALSCLLRAAMGRVGLTPNILRRTLAPLKA